MPRPVSFARFRADVLEVYSVPLKAKKTVAKMRLALDELAALGASSTSDLQPALIARWLKAHPTRSTATQDSLLRAIRAAVNLGVASGYVQHSPFAGRTRWVQVSPVERAFRHHSIEAIRRVLELARTEAADPAARWHTRRLEALVWTYAFTGLRRNEALQLRRADVDLEAELIYLRHRDHRLKTLASAAPVPIPGPLGEVLARWLPAIGGDCDWVFPGATRKGPWTGGPPGYKALDEVKQLGQRADVEGLTILSFRHSFATHARLWGLSELMLKAILRHTSIRTQRHYLHADAEDLRAAASSVRF